MRREDHGKSGFGEEHQEFSLGRAKGQMPTWHPSKGVKETAMNLRGSELRGELRAPLRSERRGEISAGETKMILGPILLQELIVKHLTSH